MLLASQTPSHPRALLIGLNLGPNLAITGSLSAILWMRVARATQAHPSVVMYSSVVALLVSASIVSALIALSVFTPNGLAV